MVSYRISCKSRDAIDCVFLLDADMTLGDRSFNDRLVLSYRDTGMAEIDSAYCSRYSFSPRRLPLGTLEELNDVCVVLERS